MEKMYWNEYPRPQMRRNGYMILNGEWKLNNLSVQMPFPPQSALSGYAEQVGEEFLYEKSFVLPADFDKECIILHFGAVDQIADVILNGKMVGHHEGGYLPFSFDVTDHILRKGENILQVKAKDTLSVKYPYGKQSKKRGGMWYTPVSGIWKTVWLENVPRDYIKNIKITPDLDGIDIALEGVNDGFKAIVKYDNMELLNYESESNNGRIQIQGTVMEDGTILDAWNWTPDNPVLYELEIITKEDKIQTYFALRTVEIKKIEGINRVCLNGKPIFLHGVLDQGYYQDGIYLPENEQEFEKDILRMKELGFNTLRKHIKIEPECFYYYCDKHGMLVVQDMVNSGVYSYIRDTVLPTIFLKKKKDVSNARKDNDFEKERKEFFKQHMIDTIEHLYNHPCIVVYTIFNEGWGQFDSDRMYETAKKTDSSRLYDSTSGWFAQEKSDFDSEHVYFRSKKLHPGEKPMFLSECGGYTYAVEDHLFNDGKSYGYGKCNSSMELTKRIQAMYERMVVPAIEEGLCGCIYTQLSDVEDEINGMYTYDRAVCKVDKKSMFVLAQNIYKYL